MRSSSSIFIPLAFLLGCSSLWFFKILPVIPYAWILAIICLSLCFFLRNKLFYLTFLLAALAGFLWCEDQASRVLQARLLPQLEGIPLTIIGTVTAIPEAEAQNVHFEFLVNKIVGLPSPILQKIRLSWYQTKDPKTLASKINMPRVHVGETWQLLVKLKQPRSTFNLASFDYEAWFFSHHINAIGYVKDHFFLNQKLSESFWKNPMGQWRERLQEKLEEALPNDQNLGMIEALAIGVRDQLNAAQWEAMQATGTNHLVAIAGLHVGFVVAFVYALIKFFWRRIPFLMLYIPAQEAAIFFALIGAFYYSALAGFALPTQRACIMLSVALLSNLFRKNIPPWHALNIALFAVLLYDPLSVFSTSFWLSFVAVGVILFCIVGRLALGSHLWQSLRIQWIIAIGLAPITLYFFHQISLINLVANGIAIPWIAFIALPLILFGVLLSPLSNTAAHALWWLASKALIPYWPVITWLASLDRLQWHTYVPSVWQLFIAMIGILIFLAPKGFPLRIFGLFGFLPLIFPSLKIIPMDNFKIIQLDVGQGLSTIIQTAHHTMVFDTGAALSESYDMGQSVVVPALRFEHISQVDLLVISHGDNDHSGGAKAVLQSLPVKWILTSVPSLYKNLPSTLPIHFFAEKTYKNGSCRYGTPSCSQVARAGVPAFAPPIFENHWPAPKILRCETGQHWTWDGVNFKVLSPDQDYYPKKGNDRSCVIRVSNMYHSALLTGDIEQITEKRLLSRITHTDVLIAPHHGSKTSSSEAFVKTVSPAWVFYATGYRNRFHFPNDEVIKRYQNIHAQSADTTKDGEIIMEVPNQPGALTIVRTRHIDRHFWNFT